MDAALPITVAARMTPWPPKPAIRILSAAYGYLCLLMGLPIPLAQLLGELMPHQFQVIGPVAIHKLPYDDLALHGERRFAGGRAMADLAGRLAPGRQERDPSIASNQRCRPTQPIGQSASRCPNRRAG